MNGGSGFERERLPEAVPQPAPPDQARVAARTLDRLVAVPPPQSPVPAWEELPSLDVWRDRRVTLAALAVAALLAVIVPAGMALRHAPQPALSPALVGASDARRAPAPSPPQRSVEAVAEPTSGPLPAPHNLAPPPITAVYDQIQAAERRLQTGEFDVMISDTTSLAISTTLRFDLGDGHSAARLHSITTYPGTPPAVIQQLVVGERRWEGQARQPWRALAAPGSVAAEVRALLPAIVPPLLLAVADEAAGRQIRWFDPQREARMTLTLDPATGLPARLDQVRTTSGAVVTIIYRGWNTRVTLPPPPSQ